MQIYFEISNKMLPNFCAIVLVSKVKGKASHVVSFSHLPLELDLPLLRAPNITIPTTYTPKLKPIFHHSSITYGHHITLDSSSYLELLA